MNEDRILRGVAKTAIATSIALAVVFALLAIVYVHARADNTTHISVAGRDVAIWKPSGPAPASGYPVILFSHGFTGCNTQSIFLMDALARDGYFVSLPITRTAGCGSARGSSSRASGRPEEPFGKANLWSASTYRDRPERHGSAARCRLERQFV